MAGFAVPQFQFSSNGAPAAGGSVNVYQTGTTTPVTLYSDGALTTPISNPVTLDSNGMCKFYVFGSVNLRMDAYTASGTLIESVDPVYPTGVAQTLSPGVFTTEASLASATTTDLGSITSTNVINITGVTAITSLGSSAVTSNPLYFLRFSGALTLTHNGTSLILPGAANITTAAGDTAVAKYEGSGNWRIIAYMHGAAPPLTAPNFVNKSGGNPTGTFSVTAAVMMGISCQIAPTSSGLINAIMTGSSYNTINSGSPIVSGRYGSGTPPANGAALTGNQVGAFSVNTDNTANIESPFVIAGAIPNLSVGVTYWLDMALNSNVTGQSNIINTYITACEIK